MLPASLEAVAASEKGKERARRFTAVWLSRFKLDAKGGIRKFLLLCVSRAMSRLGELYSWEC